MKIEFEMCAAIAQTQQKGLHFLTSVVRTSFVAQNSKNQK